MGAAVKVQNQGWTHFYVWFLLLFISPPANSYISLRFQSSTTGTHYCLLRFQKFWTRQVWTNKIQQSSLRGLCNSHSTSDCILHPRRNRLTIRCVSGLARTSGAQDKLSQWPPLKEIKKFKRGSQSLIELLFIWLNNLKSIERKKSIC